MRLLILLLIFIIALEVCMSEIDDSSVCKEKERHERILKGEKGFISTSPQENEVEINELMLEYIKFYDIAQSMEEDITAQMCMKTVKNLILYNWFHYLKPTLSQEVKAVLPEDLRNAENPDDVEERLKQVIETVKEESVVLAITFLEPVKEDVEGGHDKIAKRLEELMAQKYEDVAGMLNVQVDNKYKLDPIFWIHDSDIYMCLQSIHLIFHSDEKSWSSEPVNIDGKQTSISIEDAAYLTRNNLKTLMESDNNAGVMREVNEITNIIRSNGLTLPKPAEQICEVCSWKDEKTIERAKQGYSGKTCCESPNTVDKKKEVSDWITEYLQIIQEIQKDFDTSLSEDLTIIRDLIVYNWMHYLSPKLTEDVKQVLPLNVKNENDVKGVKENLKQSITQRGEKKVTESLIRYFHDVTGKGSAHQKLRHILEMNLGSVYLKKAALNSEITSGTTSEVTEKSMYQNDPVLWVHSFDLLMCLQSIDLIFTRDQGLDEWSTTPVDVDSKSIKIKIRDVSSLTQKTWKSFIEQNEDKIFMASVNETSNLIYKDGFCQE